METDEPLPVPLSESEYQIALDQHYAAVGRVAANWAYFEVVIDDWCLRLAKIPVNRGACLIAQISGSGRKLDAFIALADLLQASRKTIADLHKFADSARGVAERRNRAVHDSWAIMPSGNPFRLESTARKKLKLEYISMPTADVLKLAELIEHIRVRFEELATRALGEAGTSRDK